MKYSRPTNPCTYLYDLSSQAWPSYPSSLLSSLSFLLTSTSRLLASCYFARLKEAFRQNGVRDDRDRVGMACDPEPCLCPAPSSYPKTLFTARLDPTLHPTISTNSTRISLQSRLIKCPFPSIPEHLHLCLHRQTQEGDTPDRPKAACTADTDARVCRCLVVGGAEVVLRVPQTRKICWSSNSNSNRQGW